MVGVAKIIEPKIYSTTYGKRAMEHKRLNLCKKIKPKIACEVCYKSKINLYYSLKNKNIYDLRTKNLIVVCGSCRNNPQLTAFKIYPKHLSRAFISLKSHELMSRFPVVCHDCGCGTEKKMSVHHKNKDWHDCRKRNMVWLCRGCHNKIHNAEPVIRLKLSKIRKELYRTGKMRIWNKGLTKETDERVRKNYAYRHRNGGDEILS